MTDKTKKAAIQLRVLRRTLGYDVYDRLPATPELRPITNTLIEVMAAMEHLADELETPDLISPSASPAEVRDRLAQYRGGKK